MTYKETLDRLINIQAKASDDADAAALDIAIGTLKSKYADLPDDFDPESLTDKDKGDLLDALETIKDALLQGGPVKQERYVWAVTYWVGGEEPVVTTFDNQEVANKCYRVFKETYGNCCVDRCPVYHQFNVTGSGGEE